MAGRTFDATLVYGSTGVGCLKYWNTDGKYTTVGFVAKFTGAGSSSGAYTGASWIKAFHGQEDYLSDTTKTDKIVSLPWIGLSRSAQANDYTRYTDFVSFLVVR